METNQMMCILNCASPSYNVHFYLDSNGEDCDCCANRLKETSQDQLPCYEVFVRHNGLWEVLCSKWPIHRHSCTWQKSMVVISRDRILKSSYMHVWQ